MRIIVTGSAGYIGGLFIKKIAKDPQITEIVGIDLLPMPVSLAGIRNLKWIQGDLAEHHWEAELLAQTGNEIDTIVHCAFKIRNPYGKRAATEANNLAACYNVFSLAFAHNIPRLIYLSSVAAYGARRENIGRLLKESEPLQEMKNPYGYQKARVERDLLSLIAGKKLKTQAYVLRLNSITGPVGQSLDSKFGLITFLKKLLPFLPEANPHWARQFVHEDDLTEIMHLLTTKKDLPAGANPEIFNIAPAQFLTARDMGRILHKRVIRIPAWLITPLFWVAWNLSFGKVPTRPDSAMGLIYPINVDGSRIRTIGFEYRHTAEQALLGQ